MNISSGVRTAFAAQAGWCDRLDAPFTASLCRLLGERLDESSELGRRVLGWPGDSDPFVDALPLRVCGGLHFLVRSGAAPELAALYPAHELPGADALWERLRALLAAPAFLPSPAG